MRRSTVFEETLMQENARLRRLLRAVIVIVPRDLAQKIAAELNELPEHREKSGAPA